MISTSIHRIKKVILSGINEGSNSFNRDIIIELENRTNVDITLFADRKESLEMTVTREDKI